MENCCVGSPNLLSRTHFFGRGGNVKGQVPLLAQGGKVANKFQAVVVPGSTAGNDSCACIFEAGVLRQPTWEEGRGATTCVKCEGEEQQQEQEQARE